VTTRVKRSRRTKTVGHMTRDISGIISSIDEGITAILGWKPDQVVGSPSTNFLHPGDHGGAVAAWMDMLAAPGTSKTWCVRYRDADGDWRRVETVNTNHLDEDPPFVGTTMVEVPESDLSLEDELEETNQVLSQLAEALPVGLFKINAKNQIVSTNGRLHEIIGVPRTTTLRKQFATVVAKDRRPFEEAMAGSLQGRDVDDLELVLHVPTGGNTEDGTVVCSVSVRPLTDRSGQVTGSIGCLSDITERVALRRDLENRATVDQLTVCLNRGATLDLLRDLLSDRRDSAGLAVAFIDIDKFKDVNDTLGHRAGDEVLERTAHRLRSVLRRHDRVGRIGGDEFLVICPRVSSASLALTIATRLWRAIGGSSDAASGETPVSASVGIAWSAGAIDADTLIARADVAMYEAKAKGQPVLWQEPISLLKEPSH
jgi:diguanylate cyclase (GGDEF)-like protein/PAS domain S-box-containing protein